MIKIHPRLNEVLQNLFKERILDNFLALSPSVLIPHLQGERRDH